MQQLVPSWISRRFHRLSTGNGHVAHALRTLPPVAAKVLPPRAAPRLACVKPAASVHPEPGSNSSLYYFPLSSPLSRILTSSSLMSVFTLLRSALQCLQTSPNRPLPWFHYSQRSILLPPTTSSLYSTLFFPPPRIFTPSSFGIAKVLPFPFPTKCFNNFFLSPHFNTLIPTKKFFTQFPASIAISVGSYQSL